ncbi:MAG TPA: MraY family glycosyltransferase [Terriglobales bacterium]|nr:MraY family glycosyltransferase [Terriglobales bacterium]
MNHLVSFFASFGLALFLTWYVRNLALANKWVSAAPSDRHLHIAPMPRVGGVAIVLTFFSVTGVLALIARLIGAQFSFPPRNWLGFLGPGLFIFAVGLYDDFRNTGPYLKFGAQIAAAIWLFANGYHIASVPLVFGARELGFYLSLGATIFWVVLITNAFNLIDGVDGLAAGSALFSAIVMLVISLMDGNSFVSMSGAVLAGSILGFLRYNFHPATIFLGDSGSLFIGFALSALGLASSQKSHTMIAVGIPVVACGFPVLETGLSVLRRFMNGRPLFSADREHIHHKLLAMGISQRRVAIMLYAVSALFAATSLLLVNQSGRSMTLALLLVGTAVWIALQRLGYLEVTELQRVAQRTIEQKSIIANNLSIRRACESLRRCSSFSQMCRILEEAFAKNEFDRFELRLAVTTDVFVDAAPSSRERGRELYFSWAKPGRSTVLEDSCWSLSLPISSARTLRQGAFILFRRSGSAPLRIDVNLLTSDLQPSVSAALARVVNVTELPLIENQEQFAATAS